MYFVKNADFLEVIEKTMIMIHDMEQSDQWNERLQLYYWIFQKDKHFIVFLRHMNNQYNT